MATEQKADEKPAEAKKEEAKKAPAKKKEPKKPKKKPVNSFVPDDGACPHSRWLISASSTGPNGAANSTNGRRRRTFRRFSPSCNTLVDKAKKPGIERIPGFLRSIWAGSAESGRSLLVRAAKSRLARVCEAPARRLKQ